jgi:hypothetical protein
MGVDYNGNILLGYTLPSEDVQKIFRVKSPGKFHMEDRFNPLNGEKIAPLKVWDEKPSNGLFYKGEQYEMHEGFEELLEELLDCRVTLVGSWMQGEFEYVFHPEMPSPSEGGYDGGRVSYGPSYWFKDFLSLEIRLKRIKGALQKLGLDPGEPEVKLAVTIS